MTLTLQKKTQTAPLGDTNQIKVLTNHDLMNNTHKNKFKNFETNVL